MMKKTTVIFVCTNNSARSQMAEGILRHLYGEVYDVYSAGTQPTSVKPLAIEVMKEIGIDISHQHSKGIGELTGIDFDMAVNVCDQGQKTCPVIPGAGMVIHKSFEDPADLASFRKTCAEIKDWIENHFKDPDTLITIPLKL
jgi:arsenate reductase